MLYLGNNNNNDNDNNKSLKGRIRSKLYAKEYVPISLVRVENVPICSLKILKGREIPEN